MAKRKMIQSNLIKNAIAAYFAAIEIHNKPNIQYRYETVTLLIQNSWELILKAYIRKYIKGKSIFENEGHTITLDKAISYVEEDINTKNPKEFTAIKSNISQIEKYRNGVTHFYCEELEPYIFMLVAKSALNFAEFVRKYFDKDILAEEGLFIMPLGFKLPFKPEDFLSKKATKYLPSKESTEFVKSIVSVIDDLNNDGIEDSIVLGFNVYMESVKKASNSDIIAAITSSDEADFSISSIKKYRISDDPNAQKITISDEQFRERYKYSHKEVVDWCKQNIKNYKQGKLFNSIMKKAKDHKEYAFERKLDDRSDKSASKFYYSKDCLEYIKKEYEKGR